MRIVQIVLSLGVGGQEILILELSRELRARGHEVQIVTLTAGGALRDEFDAFELHALDKRDGLDTSLFGRLLQLLRRIEPDVLHTHNTSPLVYGAPAARALGIRRLIHTKHGDNAGGLRTRLLARGAAKLVSAFVAVSAQTAAVARAREGAANRKLHVIPNGVRVASFGPDSDARRAVRAELGIPDDAVVVGTVGRLVPAKNHALLVEAMRPLLSRGTRLVIVGDGPLGADITAAAREAAPYVVLAGGRRDIARVLAAFDVFAMSSRTEGVPLAVVEAMATGLPVVATAVGGLPGTVPASGGVLVAPGDSSALRQALRGLVLDADRRSRLGRAARDHAREHCSIERMTDAYESLYRS